MTGTIAEKVIKAHLVEGKMEPDEEIGIKVDRLLMQDAIGTMACLHFEALGIPKPKWNLPYCMLTTIFCKWDLKTRMTIDSFKHS